MSSRDDFVRLRRGITGCAEIAGFYSQYHRNELDFPYYPAPRPSKSWGGLHAKRRNLSVYLAVFAIQPNGQKAPLFLMHGLGGTLTPYKRLTKHLPLDQPTYGLQSQPASDAPREVRTLETLANHCLKEIRAVQANGPYYLLGHSFGGVLAVEIAQQVFAQGELVAFLGMLDPLEVGRMNKDRNLDRRGTKPRRRARTISSLILLAIFAPGKWGRLNNAFAAACESIFVFRMMNVACRVFALCKKPLPRFMHKDSYLNRLALSLYVPKRYPGRITLFRAERRYSSAVWRSVHSVSLSQGVITDERFKAEFGWRELAGAGLEVYEFPGDQIDLVREPNVRILAAEIARCL